MKLDGCTVLFCANVSPVSMVIRWFTRSKLSHCALGFHIGGVAMVADASLLGVRLRTRDRWLRHNNPVVEFAMPLREAPDERYIMQELGESYDVAGLVGFVPVLVGRWFARKFANPWANPRRMVCTEFVIRGLPPTSAVRGSLDPEATEPAELLEAVKHWPARSWPQ